MDSYQKLKAVQGLIQSLDEQIYRLDTVKKEVASDEVYNDVVIKYYNAIVEFLKGEDNAPMS